MCFKKKTRVKIKGYPSDLGTAVIALRYLTKSNTREAEIVINNVRRGGAAIVEIGNHVGEEIKNGLALLKAQNLIFDIYENTPIDNTQSSGAYTHICSYCNSGNVKRNYKFCPNCGVELAWKKS